MAGVVAVCELAVGALKAFYILPGFSLFLVCQILLWASAAGTILWFALDRFAGGG